MVTQDAGLAYRVVNPVTGEVVEAFETTSDADLVAAISAASEAFASWRSVPIAERAQVAKRVGELFVERAGALAANASLEMGKRLSEATGEAAFCGQIFDYFATEGPGLAADQPIKVYSGGKAVIQKLPIGTILGIMPWNYPFYQVARFVAPNLVLGNTMLLKHAELCPRSALAIEELMHDAGVPEGVYTNIFASHAQVATIIEDSRVQGVSLTGSERAGAAVAAIAGKNLKKCVLELGGSDPYIILDTEDVEAAADKAWKTRLGNTGQACNSNKRIIVMDDIFDAFVSRLVERAIDLSRGEPTKETDGIFTPMASRAAAERLAEQVQDAVKKGATLHVGGELSDDQGAYFTPAVLTGVTKHMRAYHEELFGPVAVVYSVSDEDEALALANDSAYGLGGAVFSTDAERAKRVAAQLETGMANVNSPAGEGPEIPFGGVKRSGFGRELGPLAMDEFANKRMFYIAE